MKKLNFSIVNRNEDQDSLEYPNLEGLKISDKPSHSILNNLDELNSDFLQELDLYKKEFKIDPFTPQDSEKFYRRICHLQEFASITQEYSEKIDRLMQDSTSEEINNSVIKKSEELKIFLMNYQTRAEFIIKKIEHDLFRNSVIFFRKQGYNHHKLELMKIQAKIEKISEDDNEENVDDDDENDNDENEETNDLKLAVFNLKKALLIRVGQHFNWIPKSNLPITNSIVKKEKDFPGELWISIAGFLNKRDLDSLSYLNKNFALIAWQTMVIICKDKFGCFPFSLDPDSPENTHPVVAYDIKLLKILNSTRKYFNNRYYTLFDPAYAELFEAIENKNCEKARHFILTQLKANKSNVIDRVFYQKNSNGETVISLADRYDLQEFLDFCFITLIVEGHRLNRDADLLVKTGRYSEVMDDLNYSMSNEARWIFACAFVCKQIKLYEDIRRKPAWQTGWMNEKEPQSLAGMAILLSSLELLNMTLVGNEEHIYNQIFRAKSFHAVNLYVTSRGLNFSPTEMAAFGKNQLIIDSVFNLMKSAARFNRGSLNLLCYFIECKDLKGLGSYTVAFRNRFSNLFNRYLNIDSDHQLTPLGVAIAKNWIQGFKYMFMMVKNHNLDDENFLQRHLRLALEFERVEIVKYLLSKGASTTLLDYSGNKHQVSKPIFYAIRKNNLQLVKLLVKTNTPLTPLAYDDKFISPLIEAALNENEAMTQYIIQKLGKQEAYEQLYIGLSANAKHKRENSLIKAAFNQVFSSLSDLSDPALTLKEEKKHSEEKFLSRRAPCFKLSLSVWVGILTGGFLEEKDLLYLLQTHSVFAVNVLQRVLDIYFLKPLSVCHLIDFSKNLYYQYASFHPRYYTLFDYDYIRLFRFVEERNLLGAQRFIESKNNDPALIDKIFYQKDGFGESVVTLARRLRFQSFLTFCYKTVLLNNMEFISRRSVVYFDLPQALSFVFSPNEPMSESVLWIYL